MLKFIVFSVVSILSTVAHAAPTSCDQIEFKLIELQDIREYIEVAPWVEVNAMAEGNVVPTVNLFADADLKIDGARFDSLNLQGRRALVQTTLNKIENRIRISIEKNGCN